MSTLNIGTVGTSSIMNVMQEAIALTDQVKCLAVCSRSEERGSALAKKVGAAKVYTDYAAMLKDPKIDVVYLASPNIFHPEQTIMALEEGKHVIVEKPAALCKADIARIEKAARENGVYFFEAITTIFMPGFVKVRESLDKLGDLKSIDIAYGQYSSKYDDYQKGKAASSLDPQLGGGALSDMGIYCIHAAVNLFGMPDDVSYKCIKGFNGADIEGTMTLHYSCGPVAECILRTAKNRNIGSGMRLLGEMGSVISDGPLNTFENAVFEADGKRETLDPPEKKNRMIYELAAFRDAILTHDSHFYEEMTLQSSMAAEILEKGLAQIND